MVQVLKEELRQSILRAAQEEFLQYGYKGASVKRIAEQVGVSVGNLYRYYAGKEILFDSIVEPVFRELELVITNHDQRPHHNENIFELVVQALTDLVGKLRKPLLILIDGSRGTRHEAAVRLLHKAMSDNVADHLAAYNAKKGKQAYSEETAWPVAVAFMQGYFEIIRLHSDSEDCKKTIQHYVAFWYEGLREFL